MTKKPGLFDQMLKNGIVLRGDDPRFTVKRLPFGIAPLDAILGGGIPQGACTLIVGPESTGKTLLCQLIVAAAQKRSPEQTTLFLDAEHSFDPEWWGQSGVDTSRVLVARPHTGENLIDLMVDAIENGPALDLIILDSIAAMPPGALLAKSAEEATVASLARLVGLMYQKLMAVLGDRTFIATNQLRENIGGYAEVYPGGVAQRYFSHIILRTRREEWIKDGTARVGFKMEISTAKNKTAAPQQDVSLPFMFAGQLDLLSVMIDAAITNGTIITTLPYYTIKSTGEKVLGKANLRRILQEQPDVLEEIERSIV